MGFSSDWMGTLKQGNAESRVLVHLQQLADGTFEGSMDNLDVGRMRIPITVGKFEGAVLRFTAGDQSTDRTQAE